jgi:hypothetical protein
LSISDSFLAAQERGPFVHGYVRACVRNAFFKYDRQVKGQLGYVKGPKWGQFGSVWISWGQVGSTGVKWGQEGPKGVKLGQVRLGRVKWGHSGQHG